jgi:Inner membrane component of T3SS, cytoplasmic domain
MQFSEGHARFACRSPTRTTMNWRSIWRRSQAWQVAVLGACCGLWAALAYEGVQGLIVVVWGPGPGALPAFFPGIAFGLVFGLAFAPLDELLGHHPRRALRALAMGAVVGALFGVAVLGPLGLLVPIAGAAAVLPFNEAALLHWGLLAPALGLIAAAAAFASGLGVRQPGVGLRRAVWGFIGGLGVGAVLGVVFAALSAWPWLHFLCFGVWGGAVAVIVYWREKRFARRWLRILTGPGEDRILPLQGRELRLGKLESNEIPLPFYQEIHPVHCQLRWNGEHYQIVDDETGGTVLVNFRQVQEQVLKTGDLVKIGSALLQYGEA